jgi:eukaryotic-like serine/threonine-protein kinase
VPFVETIANRFQLHERAGAGGMGVVRRGIDLTTGQVVAVKLLHSGQGADRFLREAAVLAELDHPAIVRFIAHGATEQGRLYIAMEWLDGRTLSEFLLARPIFSPDEAVTLARRLGEGLAAAHAAGVVHRDIKPSNVILPGDSLERATLIDFGVARRALEPRLTAVGMLVGTASYMSPEQARGERELSPASDVFSLGSLLYRTLAGRHPFQAGDATATLAKVLLDDPPRLADLSPDVPPWLDQLVAEMLSKDPASRPEDARALLARLDAPELPPALARGPEALGGDEQRVLWVLLIGAGYDPESATEVGPRGSANGEHEAAIALRHGARWDLLADRTGVVTLSDAGGDRGERALRVAHAIRTLHSGRPMALAMGLGVTGRSAPMGEVLDRAVAALARATPGQPLIDDEALSVFDPAAVTPDRVAESEGETRKLLGRATPCVGRERELVTLEALLDECFDDSVARAALIVGPTGIGKSRLRYELLRRLHATDRKLDTWLARADSLSAGSPFAHLRDALRRQAKIRDGEPLGVARPKLIEHVATVLGRSTRAFDVAVFLGELAHVPFDDADSDALRMARANAAAMSDTIRGAWLDYVAARAEASPLLLVLEDLQWGDQPTVSLVDAALRANAERPLMVLALGRPEVNDLMPGLWRERGLVEVRLQPLRRAACDELASEVLGADVDPALRRRAVELSEGNAFFLEELLRAVAEGRRELPATVMGVVQARLDALDPESRRLLRAASVFGERFWRGGVEALLGSSNLERVIDELSARELVSRRAQAAFPGESEYVFRHSIVRETAYAALTEADRVLAHRMAGQWLERAGEVDALMLAEHFQRGETLDKAARYFLASAEHALEGSDLVHGIGRARLALECDPDPATRGRIAQVLSHAHLWKGEFAEAERAGEEAVRLLEPGSPRWFAALSEVVSSSGSIDHSDALDRAHELASGAVASSDDARAAQVMCLARSASAQLRQGRRDAALATIEQMDVIRREATTLTAMMEAWTQHGRASLAYFSGDSAGFRSSLEAAIAGYELAGDTRAATNDRVNLGFALASLGDYERAERLIETAALDAERLGLAKVSGFAWHNLGWIRMQRGDARAAIALQRLAIETAATQGETLLEGSARAYLSLALSVVAESSEAEREARLAAELLVSVPSVRPHALAALARSLMAQGRHVEALAAAEEALAAAEASELPEDSDALVRLVAAETRAAAGRDQDAMSTLLASRQRILARAERVGDAELQRSFLERVPEHAKTLELCRAVPRRTGKP